MGFQNKFPKIIAYRDYKKFVNAKFRVMMLTISPLINLTKVTSKKQYLIYLISMLQSNKNIFDQIEPLL